MAKTVTKFSIFIASPNDLEEERLAVDEVIKELNKTFGPHHNVVLEALRWETDSAPGISNGSPQNLITNDIGDEYDLFIGLLWKKFGTPTDNANSGTEEEFNNAYRKYQNDNNSVQVLFYFKNAAPKSMNEINSFQLAKIENFKSSIGEKNVFYWEFDTIENLKGFLRLHIPKRISQLLQSQEKPKDTSIIENNIPQVDEELGLLDYSEQFESLIADSVNALTKIGEATEWIGEELSTKAGQIERINQTKSPNKIVVRDLLKRTAKLIENYTGRIRTEIPIFYSSFEDGIKAGTRLINISDDFASSENIADLEETKDSILNLRKIMPNSLAQMESFYQSVESLPRIQKEINIAKRDLLVELGDFIFKIKSTIVLIEEFSNSIGNKIDELKLKLEQ